MKFVRPNNSARIPYTSVKRITRFAGADLTSDPFRISENRSPDMLNLVAAGGKNPRLRPAKKLYRCYGGAVYGIHVYINGGKKRVLVHAGKNLYLDGETPRALCTNMAAQFSVSKMWNGKLYILDGCRVRVYDGAYVKDVETLITPSSETAASPFTRYYTGTKTFSQSSGSFETSAQKVSLSSGNCYVSAGTVYYSGVPTGSAVTVSYKKPGPCMTSDTFEYGGGQSEFTLSHPMVSNTAAVYLESYTTHALSEAGTASFKTAWRTTDIDGVYPNINYCEYVTVSGGTVSVNTQKWHSSLRINGESGTYYRVFTGKIKIVYDAEDLPQTEAGACRAIDVLSRALFLGASTQSPATEYMLTNASSPYDDCETHTVGAEGTGIVGYMHLQDGTQVILKTPDGENPAVYYRTAYKDSALSEAYSLSEGLMGIGGVAVRGSATIGNNHMFLSKNGAYVLKTVQNSAANEKYAQRRSYFITPAFENIDENAIMEEYAGDLYIVIGNRMYRSYGDMAQSAATGESSFEWFVWDIAATALKSLDNCLYIGCADGGIYTLDESAFEDDCVTEENGAVTVSKKPIEAYWTTPLMDFGSVSLCKQIKSAAVVSAPYVRSGVRVEYLVKSQAYQAAGELQTAHTGWLDLGDIDFSDFHFETDMFPQIISTKGQRKFSLIAFRFKALPGKPFGLLAFEVRYTTAGLARG